MRLLTVRTCNFGVNTRLVHKERGIKDSFFWAFVHNLSFFTSLLSQARVMNQVCTALIFSPRRVANNERKRCISPPILKFLSHKSRLAPLYTQPPCKNNRTTSSSSSFLRRSSLHNSSRDCLENTFMILNLILPVENITV